MPNAYLWSERYAVELDAELVGTSSSSSSSSSSSPVATTPILCEHDNLYAGDATEHRDHPSIVTVIKRPKWFAEHALDTTSDLLLSKLQVASYRMPLEATKNWKLVSALAKNNIDFMAARSFFGKMEKRNKD
ncbi:hypothetical protein BDC45DRAFT_566893 [Circinella umbellata]|nr:hypothetical protein BDC45DRAFT_566893 [Circinella umbellata]